MSRVRREQLRACEAETEAERLRARVSEAESEAAAAREARREALDLAGSAHRERVDAEAREESLKATFRAAKRGLAFGGTRVAPTAKTDGARPPRRAAENASDGDGDDRSAGRAGGGSPFGLGDAWEETPRPIGELPPPPEPPEGSGDEAGPSSGESARRDGRETKRRPAAKKAGRPPLRPKTPKNDARGLAHRRRK